MASPRLLLLALLACLCRRGSGRDGLVTLKTCYTVTEDAGALPLQVLSHVVNFRDETQTLHDHRDMLLSYAPFFAGQLFLMPGAWGPGMVMKGISSYHACAVQGQINFVYHTCLADLFESLLKPAPAWCNNPVPISGVLHMHNDMWANPRLMLDPALFDRTHMWFSEYGLPGNEQPTRVGGMGRTPHFCASGQALADDCQWGWCTRDRDYPGQPSMKEEGATALARLAASPGLRLWPEGRLCRGWSDIFYIPARFMARFASYAPAFNVTFHEVAMPTLIQLTMVEAGAPEAFTHTRCEGSCCERAGDDLRSYTCAHRLDLRNRTVREGVVLALLT